MARGSTRGKKEADVNSPSLSEPQATVQLTETTTVNSVKETKTMSETTGSILELSEDLNNAEAPPLLPKSTYPAQLVGATPKVSQSGNSYLETAWRIPAEAYPADFDGDPDGVQVMFRRTPWEDNAVARYRLRRFLESIGAKLGRSVDPSDLLGSTANLEIDHETFEGETRLVVKRVLAA